MDTRQSYHFSILHLEDKRLVAGTDKLPIVASDTPRTHKLIPLEGQRGIAAFVVFLHHFILGFHPSLSGLLPESRTADSMIGSPVFVFINGPAAVFFFFTLSGFVLTWSFFQTGKSGNLALAAAKRWPRLVLPVLVTTIGSVLLFKLEAYYFVEAGSQSGSTWLARFGYSSLANYQPSIQYAAWQGLTTFFTGDSSLNSSLWTMAIEFYGSLFVFAVASLISFIRHRAAVYSILAFCALLSLVPASWAPSAIAATGPAFVIPFTIGVALSYTFTIGARNIKIGRVPAVLCLIVGLYLLGYAYPTSWYRWADLLQELPAQISNALIFSTGAAFVIFATMANGSIFKAMNIRAMAMLGRLSFPLYLVHFPLLASVASLLFITVLPDGGIVLFAATLGICLFAAVILLFIDEWWVRALNRIFGALRNRKRHDF